jgi:hypothetical protein
VALRAEYGRSAPRGSHAVATGDFSMLQATVGLAAACLALLLILMGSLGHVQRRLVGLSRIEAKLDLLLAEAGLEYDPLKDALPEIVEILRRGDKIGAIKCYRNASGVGLKDAKDYVEELQRRAGL